MESIHLLKAIKESEKSKFEYDDSRKFSTFKGLLASSELHKCSKFWDKIAREDLLVFTNMEYKSGTVVLNYAVTIDVNLCLTISIKGENVNHCYNIPSKLENINDVHGVLDQIEELTLKKTEDKNNHLTAILKNVLGTISENMPTHKPAIDFLYEQISLLTSCPEKYRYTIDTLIFSSMFYLVSPQAYRFVRQTNLLILPHPSTLHKLNSKLNSNPQLQQNDINFLKYIKQKATNIKESDTSISLMIDEIHIKKNLDYKGGDITGMSHDNSDLASSAHVFMITSLFSKYKDVVHILPVQKITADILFSFIKKIIIELEKIGFRVIVIVSDNNSINRKAVSFFNNPLANFVYPHPCDSHRPLFYCIDSVHLIKCVRNNWLNQKNDEQAMYFPSFDTNNNKVYTASFLTLKNLYETECGSLLKHGYTLSQKCLWPTNIERQNVKLALQIFNNKLSKTLKELDGQINIVNLKSTSNYIEIFVNWFDVMNVKTPKKGLHLLNSMCTPLTIENNDEKLLFLDNFLNWLKKWDELSSDTGRLSKETHSALIQSTHCIINLTHYCITELNMSYILPGKIQTDELEYRFSLYRRLAGTNYHVSIRQMYEVENKIRVFSKLKKLTMVSSIANIFEIDEFFEENSVIEDTETEFDKIFLEIKVSDKDINDISEKMPLITYVAGYCVHSVLNRIKCDDCKDNLSTDKKIVNNSNFKEIHKLNRGGLKFPSIDVLNVIVHNFIVVQKIIGKKFEEKFLRVSNQRQLITNITTEILLYKDMNIGTCNKHASADIIKLLIRSCTNTLLKNYCKSKKEAIKLEEVKKNLEKNEKKAKRKLKTLTKDT